MSLINRYTCVRTQKACMHAHTLSNRHIKYTLSLSLLIPISQFPPSPPHPHDYLPISRNIPELQSQLFQLNDEAGEVLVISQVRLNLLLFPVCLPDGPLLLLVEGGGLWMPCMGLQPLVPCHGWVIWGHELPCSAILVLAVWQVARWSVVASGS